MIRKKVVGYFDHLLAFCCRDEATRTPDPYVPNVVRYQLRYIPIAVSLFSNWLQSYYFLADSANF